MTALSEPFDPAAPDPDEERAGFQVSLENFTGPFDLLLQLIGRHELDVTEVALHRVTDDFIAYTAALGDGADLEETTGFLVVAATLLDLKAARLLPAAEVEDEDDLALLEARDVLFARLLQYRAYQQVAALFRELEGTARRRWPRAVSLPPELAELLPPVELGVDAAGFAEIAAAVFRPAPPPTVGIDHLHASTVSVPEQVEIMAGWLQDAGRMTFAQLCENATEGIEVVGRFLGVLEMYRSRQVALDQDEAFAELAVRWAPGSDDRGTAALDPEAP
ncbi:segregation/condensation protein A [Actinomycetospora endophytica]|uniref:Segregation and condensation protein A n=1 Tax=Actinomycetospora endophytica TaxID=2291215 RepID=A0ABS8PBH1_9PSEU|nr:segregation/condensation protein A [Actinomycetospora endophytica]MCD2194771.1 segregation/condensation protein A [Actinomycetospora endophytica]